MKNKKSVIVILISMAASLIFFLLPFLHGHYPNTYYIDYENLAFIDLSKEDLDGSFIVVSEYLNGYQLYLSNMDKSSNAIVEVETYINGELIDKTLIEMKDIGEQQWYSLLFDKPVATYNDVVFYHIHASNAKEGTCLLGSHSEGWLLINNISAKETFFRQDKVMLIAFFEGAVLLILAKKEDIKNKKVLLTIAYFLIGYALLNSQFLYNNVLRSFNKGFSSFHSISDELLTNAISSDQKGLVTDNFGIPYYSSQFGLHGFIFRIIARLFNYPNVELFRFLTTSINSLVILLICYFIKENYNSILSIVFFVTFWLSPWVSNFARNLYWVEFTFFMPMLVGLVFLKKKNNKTWRYIVYLSSFATIMIKCLCGYEFLTTVMMGLISFPLIEMFSCLIKKDYDNTKILFKQILFIGVCAILGFVVAIIMHGYLKGNGNIIIGIKSIVHDDALRRISSTSLNDYSIELWDSLNASIWDTLKQYFIFANQDIVYNEWIIAGIHGSLFLPIIITPLAIFVRDYYKNDLNTKCFVAYLVMFISSISWFVMCKAHSYIHVHTNFIVWYFGFIQICFYIIIKFIINVIRRGKQF